MDAAHPGTLYHHGIHGTPEKLRTGEGRAFLERIEIPQDARERIQVALAMVDAIEAQIAPLERELRRLARRQTGCKALMSLYGMGFPGETSCLTLVWAVLDLYITHATNGIKFTQLERQVLKRMRYEGSDPALQEELTAA